MTIFDFDYIIVGSGFGGSVMTWRLVEKGYKVALLERGREYKMHSFPRRPEDIQKKMFWDPNNKTYGLMEFRDYPDSDAVSLSGAGLGGGSLIYANVMYRMPKEFFGGWPKAITRESLDPYYDRAHEMLDPKPYPTSTDPFYADTPKTKIYEQTAKKLSTPEGALAAPRFVQPDLAVYFKGDFPGQQSLNKHGAVQSKCIKCGECDIGCNIHAKNSLDLNYIHKARTHANAADIRTNAEVTVIRSLENEGKEGYEVIYINPAEPSKKTILRSKNVIVSAGSVHSTALLLQMYHHRHLPKINSWLGKNWCANGDLLGTAFECTDEVRATEGPVITSAIEYRFENAPDGFAQGMYIEDAGYPTGLEWYLAGRFPEISTWKYLVKLVWHFVTDVLHQWIGWPKPSGEINLGKEAAGSFGSGSFTKRVFVLLGMGRDRSTGTISLGKKNEPLIKWDYNDSKIHYTRTRAAMQDIATKMGGKFRDNPLTWEKKVVAVHPLGGCPMGDSPTTGAVGTNGQVFGHPGLYVVDASIIPTSVGPNPSLTIAALAEYIANQIPARNKAL